MIQESWNKQCKGAPTYILCRKIIAAKAALKHWNKAHFRKIQFHIHKKKKKKTLLEVQSLSPSPQNQFREQLQYDLQKQLKNEETLWRQKSRISWLITTNLNTKLYHLSTTIQRMRNAINFIKLSPSIWSIGQSLIETIFLDYLQNIYASSNPINPGNLENLFKRQISYIENDFLSAISNEA